MAPAFVGAVAGAALGWARLSGLSYEGRCCACTCCRTGSAIEIRRGGNAIKQQLAGTMAKRYTY